MVVCICNAVNTSEIREAIHHGARNVDDVRDQTMLGTCCGQCVDYAKNFISRQVSSLAVDASV